MPSPRPISAHKYRRHRRWAFLQLPSGIQYILVSTAAAVFDVPRVVALFIALWVHTVSSVGTTVNMIILTFHPAVVTPEPIQLPLRYSVEYTEY